MRLNVVPLLRRVRRIALSPISHIQHLIASSGSPHRRHYKIDDEESYDDEYEFSPDSDPRHSLRRRMITMFFVPLCIFLALLLLLAYMIYKPPNFVINFLQRRYPEVLFHVPLSQRTVALTLDDAPSSYTSEILDLLKAYGAKATFFVIGSQIAENQALLQRMHDEGHELGNHAWNDFPSMKLPLPTLEQQMMDVEVLLPLNSSPNGGRPPKYFRPGSGFFNRGVLDVAKHLGYRVILGGIYPHDPQIHNPRVNARHVLSMVNPGGIIIMHDRRSYSPEQVELVLKGLAAGGWKVESVGGLLRAAEESKELKDA